MFGPSNVVRYTDGFFYCLHPAHREPKPGEDFTGTCVMRTRSLDRPRSRRHTIVVASPSALQIPIAVRDTLERMRPAGARHSLELEPQCHLTTTLGSTLR